ncbi:MAG TPA: AMP-binding protein [Candidatus Acidoferrum sp.]|nr:AMP-binding protein [Candidatus Acidoferrum sp.]
MSAPNPKLDHDAAIEAEALATVRKLLAELGGSRGIDELAARGVRANLERDLGLGSLERVELMLRLGDACGVRLPESVMAEANTVADLVAAIVQQGARGTGVANLSAAIAGSAAVRGQNAVAAARLQPDLEQQVRSAETLTEVLRLRALGQPAFPHIHIYEETPEPRTITFGQLYERASSVAGELGRRGLEVGQTVAIMLPTCAEFFSTFFGVLLAGGIPVPIYPPFRADKIAEYAQRQTNILRNAEARFLVTWRQAEGLARLLKPNVPTLGEVLNAQRLCRSGGDEHESVQRELRDTAAVRDAKDWRPVENLTHRARGEDIAFLQYTSGSTGAPKGVVLTHANLLANIRSMIDGVQVTPKDTLVSWLPLYHDMGMIGAWLAPLLAGIPTVIMSPLAFLSQPERWLWAIHRHRATLSPGPNFAYELCVRKIDDKQLQGPDRLDLGNWRAAMNGSEPVQVATLERFAARFAPYGLRREALLPVYGLAENSLAISATDLKSGYRVDRIERETFESSGRAFPARSGDGAALEFVGAGKPLRDVECRIVNNSGTDAGERVEGHLWFRGPAATSGYYKNPEATRELMRGDGWHDSGDLAYLADGDLFITGRAKDIIIKAGRNLYPHEIEQIVGHVKGVRPGCVVAFGAADERSGTERFVVVAEIRTPGDEKRISAEISTAVQEAMGLPPDVVELVPPQSIPKTSSGKLRRSETKRRYLEGNLGKRLRPPWMQIAKLAIGGFLPRTWTALRSGLKNAVEFVYGVYAMAAVGAVVAPAWILVKLTHDSQRAARILHSGSRILLKAAFVRVHVEGGELLGQLPNSGPWIFAPNHSSYLDLVVATAVLPPTVRFISKGDAVEMPVFGTLVKRSGQYLFDRNSPDDRVHQARELEEALGRGESLVVYPEGTFTPVTGIRPFQLGAFKAAVDSQRPICPVAIRGARQILRDKTYLPKFGRVMVTLGPLIYPTPGANDWQEIVRLRDETRAIIARNVTEPVL